MMKKTLLLAVFLASNVALADGPSTPFSITNEMHIGGPGRWDYVSVDPATHNLYVTRSTHTQVIDPVASKVVADIPGGVGLHGTAIVPSLHLAFITDGKAAKLLVVDTTTNTLLGTIVAADDADGTIYDAHSDRVLVSCGDANALLILDPHAELATATVEKVDLGGKPEFLAADAAGRVFVCLADKNMIAVVDLKTKKVIDRWPTGTGTSPAGLALDEKNGRLFVGCHNEKLVVIGTADGKVQTELPIGSGNDACLFDPGTGVAYASCNDGTLTVISASAAGDLAVTQTVKTKSGSRTAGIDPATHIVYVPAVDMNVAASGKRPTAKPDSFSILAVAAKAADAAH